MKKFRNLVIGGIETKVVNLILIALLLVAGIFLAFMLSQENMLTSLTQETSERQISAMTGTTGAVIDQVIVQNMDRITGMEAQVTDTMFRNAAIRVRMTGEYARKLLENPDSLPRAAWQRPETAQDGEMSVKVLLAEGLEASASEERLGLIANLSDMMVSICAAYESDNMWFTLPEGITLMADTASGKWIREDGSFADLEIDHRTGELCVTCAMPVYGTDGKLLGVAGTDLFLSDMQQATQASSAEGGILAVVNQQGHVIISPAEQGDFRVSTSGEAVDLRESENAELAAFVREAMENRTEVRRVPLSDGTYYMIGVPMKTVGWALIAAFSEEIAGQPVRQLEADYQAVQEEAVHTYQTKFSRGKPQMWVLLGIAVLATLAGAIILGKRIVRPLNTITRRIAELSETNMEFKMEDTYRTGDEVEALAECFAEVSHKTLEYLETVKQVTAEKERIGTELSLATRIQSSMLPHIVPAFPSRTDFDIIGSMHPAKEVGGDFYDYFLIDDDHLGMVMADVSGKGVPAALFMMASKIILQSVAMLGASPAEILTRTNDAICSNNEAGMFVTVWVGILELSTGKLTCSNAGHEYPVFKRPGGDYELYKDKHAFVVGGLEGVKYKEYEIMLEPGSRMFVYTDGVPEATNARHELFGTARMVEALNRDREAEPMDVLKNVRKAVDDFVEDAEQFDDMTMLCLEYKGPRKDIEIS